MNMTPTCNDGTPNRVFGLPLALLALFAWSLALQGAYLWSVPVTVSQPDGEVLHLLATGDEYYNWVHDKDNYTIVRDPNTGVVEYARVESGKLAPSGYRVGTVKPDAVGLQPGANVFPDRQELPQGSPRGEPEPAYPAPTSGTINNLVVFIRFSGESEFTDAVSLYDTQFNTSVSSMNQYFQEASYGALATSTTFYPLPSGSTVVSYQDSQPRAYYQPYDEATNPIGYTGGGNGADRTAREHTLLVNAVNAVSGSVPAGLNLDGDGDGRVDNVCFVVYGGPTAWSTLLWPHMWSLYSQTVSINGKRVYTYNFQLQTSVDTGVLCHEMGHSLGAPDLYRYYARTIVPIGRWDVMSGDQLPPQHMSAYMKFEYFHWITSIPEITPDGGTYTLNPLTSSTGQSYRIASNNSPTEFFVVEYRRKAGTFESSIPGSGLLVYRINTAVNGNASGPPDEVYVYRPGGTYDVSGTVDSANYSSNVGRTSITDDTSPSSFLTNGSLGGLCIWGIGAAGDTISFKVGAPEIDIQRPASTSIPDGDADYLGNRPAGAPITLVYTVVNSGQSSLSVTGVTAANLSNCSNFLVNTTMPLTIAVGTSGSLSVSITPTSAGAFSFDMDVASNDLNENPYDIAVVGVPPPNITASPPALTCAVAPDATRNLTLSIGNTGSGNLTWAVSVENAVSPKASKAVGGPDTYGYKWKDSNEAGGPTYGWIDITSSGMPLVLRDDDASSAIPLAFSFDFYGEEKAFVYISANGYLSFDHSPMPWSNAAMPNPAFPNDLVAPFWDDLDPSAGGEIYYLAAADRFVVSWVNVPRFSGGSNTFQVILYPDGRILFQYESMGNGATLTSATTGIENGGGTDGLGIAYNESYVANNLAVLITSWATWISITPPSGTTSGGGTTPVSINLSAAGLSAGDVCTCNIVIASNDPDTPLITVPLTMNVALPPPGTAAVFRVTSAGDVLGDGAFYGAAFLSGSADVAEWVPVTGPAEPGTILELDPQQPGAYRPSQGTCSLLVGGVVSSQPGMVLGGTEPAEGYALLALSGIVPVKVTNEGGPIQPGDLLVSSSTPGYAMRWASEKPCPCALVGKALGPMTDDQGVISVLLTAH
jgi:M6 family metalloprotease-like protein